MDQFGFQPDPGRTRQIDLAIRQALADSVAQVLERAAGLGIPWSGDLGRWRGSLLQAPMAPPRLWACYRDLVQAVVRADEDALSAIASELMAMLPDTPSRAGRVVTISGDDLGAVDAERYRAIIDGDPDLPLGLLPAVPAEIARVADLVAEARALLADAAPDLLDEIDTLGHEIVLATNDGRRGFGGAASVFLWGAVILNPGRLPDRVTLVESLAHETAHALLFGLTLGADLTTNDPAKRYVSPLRADPRPIEGIVHATYVLARMVHALDRLSGSTRLDAAERDLIRTKLNLNRANYRAGLGTVQAHARLTPEGEAIMTACETAMV